MAGRTTSTGGQRLRLGIAALVATASVDGAPVAATPAPVAHPCTEFAASTAFARDKVAFCAGEEREPRTGDTTGIAFFATTDGGRSWARRQAAGLVVPSGSNVLRDVFVSPRYADDGAVFLQMSNGLHVSVDDGATFLLVDPLAWGRLAPFAAALNAPTGEAAARALFAHALPGDAEGANRSTLIDPSTRVRTPVKGSPGRDVEFAIPPGFAADGQAFVVAEHGVGLTRHVRLYGCSVALECSTPLHRFPNRWDFDRIWLAPDFATSRTMFLSISTLAGEVTLWRSRDAGRTFTRWTSAERLQRGFSSVVFGITGVPGTRQLYLRISGNGARERGAAPFEQLFWSRDSGGTWSRVSYGRTPQQQGPRGTMPPAAPLTSSYHGETARGMVAATGDGRVFVLGSTIDGAARYRSLYCTVDNGRRWARSCAR